MSDAFLIGRGKAERLTGPRGETGDRIVKLAHAIEDVIFEPNEVMRKLGELTMLERRDDVT